MEYPCHRCRASVEEGTAFCPHCAPVSQEIPHTATEATSSIDWSRALVPATWGALVAISLIVTRLAAFGIAMLAAGALAVVFYHRRNRGASLSAGAGARLGAVSGALGFGILTIVFAFGTAVLHTGAELRQKMLDAVQQAASRSSDPQAAQAVEFLKTPQGLVVAVILGLILTFVAFVFFSGLGGVVGAALREKAQLMSASEIERTLVRLAHEIIEKNDGAADLGLVGIRRRGVFLAQRLGAMIQRIEKTPVPVGSLDITLYRDDLSTLGPKPVVQKSEIGIPITGKNIILVDDVLYTGRTTRAAMDALFSHGRPKRVQLCVLIDRGHRELPVEAQFVGRRVQTTRDEIIEVQLRELDEAERVLLVERRS